MAGWLVGSLTGATSATEASNFYGFQGIVMDRLTVRVRSSDNMFLLDTLQNLPVPEPLASLLLAVGLAALGLLVQRSRRTRAD